MSTVCKISLDAEEYKRELSATVAASREAAAQMNLPSGGAAAGNPTESGMPDGRAISVKAEVSGLEDVEKLAAAIRSLPDSKTVSVKPVGTVDTQALEKATSTAKDISSGALRTSEDVKKVGSAVKSVPVEGFRQRAKQAFTEFKDSLLSGKKPLEQITGGILSMLNPWALAMAAVGAFITIAKECWDNLTVSAEEYASKMDKVAEASSKARAKEEEQLATATGYLDRLRELSSSTETNNAVMAESSTLLTLLERKFGSLGAEIDPATGKLLNFAEVLEKVNQKGRQGLAGKLRSEIADLQKQASAQYVVFRSNEWLTIEGEAKRESKNLNETPVEAQLAYMKRQRDDATTSAEIEGYAKQVAFLEEILARKKQLAQLNQTGYASEADQAAGKQAVTAAGNSVENSKRQQRQRVSDDAFADARDIDDKIANRQQEITAELEKQKGLAREIAAAKAAVASAEDDKGRDAALRLMYELELQSLNSKEKAYAFERQIVELKKAQAEAYKKLTEQAQFELDYNSLIVAGEYEKAAVLKLEKELRDQNLKLTEAQKQKILEQRAALEKQAAAKTINEAREEVALTRMLVAGNFEAYEAEKLRLEMKRQGKSLTEAETAELLKQRALLAAQNLKKSLQSQAYDLYGQAMERSGRGKEFAEEKALRDARNTKGRDLTEAETEQVKKLSKLSWDLANMATPQFGDTSVKTNSLTARGGFAGGAKMPNTEKIARETMNYAKKQTEMLEKVKTLLEEFKGE